ncbi:MAG: winged helix-turn-helix transcriptional regulator [Campylobacter sp.]|nr:winged helix-turn-helix transcriptional regulator [Campylobacter sp.]
MKKLEEFLKITGALNDETRILLLAFLSHYGSLCVCDLQASLAMTQSRLSRHLKILKDAGFLEVQRKGAWAYYEIKKEPLEFCKSSLEYINKLNLKLPELKGFCREKNMQKENIK